MYRSVLALLFASALLAYFYVIDPTVQNRQGNDRGSQYQTGVYFTNESARETVKRIAEIERGRSEKFFVEILSAQIFGLMVSAIFIQAGKVDIFTALP